MGASLGMIIYAAVKPIFKIYAIIAIGFYLSKKNILTVSTCRDISDLIVTAIFPSLIFNNIVSHLKSSDIKNLGIIFFTAILLFGVGALLAAITYFTTKSPKKWLGGLLSVGLFPNISDLPIAYLQTLSKTQGILTVDEGNRGVAFICIFVAAQIFFQFSLGLYKLVEWDFRDELKEKDSLYSIDKSHDSNRLSNIDENEIETKKNPANKNQNFDTLPSSSNVQIEPLSISPSSSVSLSSSQPQDFQDSHLLRPHNLTRTLTSNSMATQHSIMQMVPSRVAENRAKKAESIEEVINQYSDYDHYKHEENNSIKTSKSRKLANIKSKLIRIVKDLISPSSLALIIGIAIAMAPPLKALFVPVTSPHIPSAPDQQPPLSFIIDITTYLGQASVPLGLLLLGATIARLKVKNMYPGFWKTATMITLSRLVILPIFGVGLTTGLYKAGWYGDEQLIRFVSVLEFGVPSATSLVYFTAFYTDPNSENHLQMDCLAICLIFQYVLLFITLPFLITFTLKVSLSR